MRDGPLPACSWVAGREGCRVLVAMVKGSLPPYHPQPSSQSLGEEERRRRERPAQIQIGEIGRFTAPMIEQHGPAGVGDETLQRDHQQIQVIDLAEKWNEVRYE